MKQDWKPLLGAFLLGIFMPSTVFGFVDIFVRNRTNAPQTSPDEEIIREIVLPIVFSDEVRQMPLEEYLVGVVLGEMPASFSMEALKAQAVAARTCALEWSSAGSKHPNGGVCVNYKCCQSYVNPERYGGTEKMLSRVKTAVAETAGQVLTYDGALIQATYFSCSGGKTEDAVAVWGESVPYLQSVVSPGEEWSPIYEDAVFFTPSEFAACLGRDLTGDCAGWLGQINRTRGGGVDSMVIGGVRYSGTHLRSLLSLNSTAFTMKAEKGGITVTTTGKGHRVGMSQYGAETMARDGSSFSDILGHYYPGTRIDKWMPFE